VQPSSWRILLQALLHDPTRASRLTDLPETQGPEAGVVQSVVSLAREHPEMATRDIVEHFRGRPEQAWLTPAAAELMHWDENYDIEADFQGALATVMTQANRIAVKELSGRKPSDLSDQEKADLLASLKSRKPG
jgi:hypothetical protein